eukprot:9119266-Alexandrium_andersonii.AAC.1
MSRKLLADKCMGMQAIEGMVRDCVASHTLGRDALLDADRCGQLEDLPLVTRAEQQAFVDAADSD